jgi:hypothetical protein
MDVVQRYPEIRARVLGLVTYAGVVQGTGASRMALDKIKALTGREESEGILAELVKHDPKILQDLILSSTAGAAPWCLDYTPLKQLLLSLGIDLSKWQENLWHFIEAHDLRQIFLGMEDLSLSDKMVAQIFKQQKILIDLL